MKKRISFNLYECGLKRLAIVRGSWLEAVRNRLPIDYASFSQSEDELNEPTSIIRFFGTTSLAVEEAIGGERMSL